MTTLSDRPTSGPVPPPHLLTIDEYAAFGETEPGYTELVEGRIVMSPSPVPDHNYAVYRLGFQLEPLLPEGYEAVPDIDVDLQLAPPDAPGFSRRPDLVVVRNDARRRIRHEGGMYRASDVLLVVEVVSSGSSRTDRIVKRDEYADAGIRHYWLVDISEPVSLLAYRHDGSGYVAGDETTARYTTTDPFEVIVDLRALL